MDSPGIFGPCLLWLNGCMHQNTTWYGGRPQPRRHCVRWGPSFPPPKGHSPQFSSNVRCSQTAGWTKMPLGSLVWRLASAQATLCSMGTEVPRKKGTAFTQFLAHVYCCQTAGWMKTRLGTEIDLGPGHIVLDRDPAPPRKGHSSPPFRPMSICDHGRPSQG